MQILKDRTAVSYARHLLRQKKLTEFDLHQHRVANQADSQTFDGK